MAPNTFPDHKWWKESTIYQIYPASFCSTGSGEPGWGDINGITSKLDYLKSLGIDIIWLSPIYKSPQVDMGYDISDYEDIDPRYGTLADVDNLIKGLKARGMKLMMDLVVNHTSDQHAWFQDSRSSKTSSKRDWYIWHPGKKDAEGNRIPPNNWGQILGPANSAWTWDEQTQEYYLSLFTPEQPDLNWRNPAVREAVQSILRFWLDRGASGFRMDVINLISKVEGFPDADIKDPNQLYQPGHKLYANGPMLHTYLKELNEKVLSRYDTITVGEMPFIDDSDEILRVVNAERKELNMIFIFDLVDIDNEPGGWRLTRHPFDVHEMRRIINKWQTTMQERQGWNSVFIENHDNPRSVTRYVSDSDQYRDLGAKLVCLMQTTLSGTLYVYQGEELGMRNLPMSVPPEEYLDIESINFWKKEIARSKATGNENILKEAHITLQRKARDHARTPIPWSNSTNAGFCPADVKPWMTINPDYTTHNADAQVDFSKSGELSVWQFWQRGLQDRKKHKDVFVYGTFEVLGDDGDVLAYVKRSQTGEAFVTVLNFSGGEKTWRLPGDMSIDRWVAGNYDAWGPDLNKKGELKLRPWEGVLGKL
jgi:oligo-1,6-glucosidase